MLPVLLGVLVYLYVDHRYARALFGGNEGVGSWIGFALTQPATYLFALPAVGVAAELIPVTFRRRMPMRGAVYAGLGVGRRRRPLRASPSRPPTSSRGRAAGSTSTSSAPSSTTCCHTPCSCCCRCSAC